MTEPVYTKNQCAVIGACGYWFCQINCECLLKNLAERGRVTPQEIKSYRIRPKANSPSKFKTKKVKIIKHEPKPQARNKDCNHPLNGKTLNVFRKIKEAIFCAYCEVELKYESQVTRDHLIPMSKGGVSLHINLVWCCQSCNNLKGSSSLNYWLYEIDKEVKRLAHTRIYDGGIKLKYYETIQKNIPVYIEYVEEHKDRLWKSKFKRKHDAYTIEINPPTISPVEI